MMRDEERQAWLALSRLPGLGGTRCQRLVISFGSALDALAASTATWAEAIGKGAAESARAVEPDWAKAEDQLRRLHGLGGRLHVVTDVDYPPLLRETASPPPLLFVLGKAELQAPSIAIVGTRNPSRYGRELATKLARGLAMRGLNVISGMARGVDAAAHEGALQAGAMPGGAGETVAVLGSGVDVVYPPDNRQLHEKLRERGGVVSEFPMGSRPQRGWFPRRNRLISGLSFGVVLVETPARSGALITARYAQEQNREVFAVPGDVRTGKSAGCHGLIRDGAKLVESLEDVLEELQPWVNLRTDTVAAGESAAIEETGSAEARISSTQADVLARLDTTPCHIDELGGELGLEADRVLGALTELELGGWVERHPGMLFSRTESRLRQSGAGTGCGAGTL